MDNIKKIVIVCLPVAGEADPTQLLMIEGLNRTPEIEAFTGINDRFLGIIRSALRYKPDYIHFDWIESYYIRRNILLTYINLPLFYFQILICKYILRIKLACTIHNMMPHKRKNSKLKFFVLKSFGHLVNFIRVTSPASVEHYCAKFRINKTKVHFIGMGDYTEFYPNKISADESRKTLKIPENVKVILTLGSIKRYKGIPEYLYKIKEINDPNLYILIAGKCMDMQLNNEITAIQDERIHYLNKFIAKDELQYYYNAADIVILPFLEIENSGSVVMAMGFRKAIVAPVSNVINDRLKFQKDLLFTPTNFEQIIEKALSTPLETLRVYGESNFKQLKEYSWADFGPLFLKHRNKNEAPLSHS